MTMTDLDLLSVLTGALLAGTGYVLALLLGRRTGSAQLVDQLTARLAAQQCSITALVKAAEAQNRINDMLVELLNPLNEGPVSLARPHSATVDTADKFSDDTD
jgi:hypothetical protein